MKKTIWIIIIAVVAGGVIFFVASRKDRKEYVTANVSRGNVSQAISVTGKVVSKDEALVSSETGGQVEDVFVSVGDRVSKGQKIVSIDGSVLVSQLREAKAWLRIKEEEEKLARRNWNKIKPEERQAKIQTTQQAREAVQTIREKISKTNLYSPIDGIISEVNFKKGETVPVNGAFAVVLKNEELEIEADVPESDVAGLDEGQIAEIEFDAFDMKADSSIQAKIYQIYPAANVIQDVVYYKIKLELIGDDERIKPGMSVDIDVLTDERKDVLIVPNQSINVVNGDRMVTVLDEEGLEVEKKVTVGMKGDDGMTEIISGLSEGETVVTFVKE